MHGRTAAARSDIPIDADGTTRERCDYVSALREAESSGYGLW